MKPPLNLLDHLADCADICGEDFAGSITRRRHEGAHGPGSTADLLITVDGQTWRITATLEPEAFR